MLNTRPLNSARLNSQQAVVGSTTIQVDIQESAATELYSAYDYAVLQTMTAKMSLSMKTFYQTFVDVTGYATSDDFVGLAIPVNIVTRADAANYATTTLARDVREELLTYSPCEVSSYLVHTQLDTIQAAGYVNRAESVLIEALAQARLDAAIATTIAVDDSAEAALDITANRLLAVLYTDTVDATTYEDLKKYSLARVLEVARAGIIFRLGDEVVQGWVMNMEGNLPISRYDNWDFNSFCCINGTYFAASDTGLYTLGAATDDGLPIQASVKTLKMDFGSSTQKRVVSAYLGYTATGKMVLKVGSVDQGVQSEHWYEAREAMAASPREGYVPLGRGLKSRYWQLELANVDGADFELDKLELYPLELSRRV